MRIPKWLTLALFAMSLLSVGRDSLWAGRRGIPRAAWRHLLCGNPRSVAAFIVAALGTISPIGFSGRSQEVEVTGRRRLKRPSLKGYPPTPP